MGRKYRVSGHARDSKQAYTGTRNSQPLIGKGKIVAILFFGTLFVAGIYIAAMHAHFLPIFHIYWIITAVLLCVFAFASNYCKQLYEKSLRSDGSMTEEAKIQHLKRTKYIKYLLLVLMPFLFTVIGDTVYVLILQDSGIIEAITKLFTA